MADETTRSENQPEKKEDDYFKVVVPKTEMVKMDPPKPAKVDNKVKVFADFYIDHLKENDLELLTKFDETHFSNIELNNFIIDNSNFNRQDLLAQVMQKRGNELQQIIKDIEKNSKTKVSEFNTKDEWNDWYNSERQQTHRALS